MKTRRGPWGVHLYNRRNGLNMLLDEVRVPREEWNTAPRYLSVALTNSCNLSCPSCYAPKTNSELDVGEVVSWARELDQDGCFGIGIGGGEPTMHDGLVRLVGAVRRQTELAITLTTNGHGLSDTLVRALDGKLDLVRVSMDGVGSTYQRLRGRSFSELLDRIRAIRTTYRLGVNYLVNRQTIRDLPEAARIAWSEGAAELLLLPEVRQDGTLAVDEDTRRALNDWINANYTDHRIATSLQGASMIDAPLLPVRYSDGTCDLLHIDARGILRPSAFSSRGVRIRQHPCLLEAIRALRLKLDGERGTTGVEHEDMDGVRKRAFG